MSNDHFVARTYLANFGDDANGGMLNAYRKSDGRQFPCWPADVCSEWNGDLNPKWLKGREDLLGQFRSMFEPLWNAAVKDLLAGTPSATHKFAISGFVANLMTCVPAWRRIGAKIYADQAKVRLKADKERLRADGNSILVEGIEMLERGKIGLEFDPEFIKAQTTRQLLHTAWMLHNQDWTIISQRWTTSVPHQRQSSRHRSVASPWSTSAPLRLHYPKDGSSGASYPGNATS
jgi:hypothetical protein